MPEAKSKVRFSWYKNPSYGKRIKEAGSVEQLALLYARLKYHGAAVGDFDFQSDQKFYECYVEGKLEQARKLALTRYKSIRDAGGSSLVGKKIDVAKEKYRTSRSKWSKTHRFKDIPLYFVDMSNGVAEFSVDEPDEIKTPFGNTVKNPKTFSKKKGKKSKV